jgi:predicted DNA-binding transcriptional regulator AlpA
MSKPKVNTVATQPVIPESGYVRVYQLLGTRRGTIPILPLSRSGLYLWIRDGRFPAPQKLGKVVVWPASTIRVWLQEMEAAHEAAK